jgi:hypothetical protein
MSLCRVFQKNSSLDYYESGADLRLSEDMLESFLKMLKTDWKGISENAKSIWHCSYKR